MAHDRPYDFTLNGKGYLLWRFGPGQGRAWSRKGQSDTAALRSADEAKYGRLEDEIEFAAVYNDFSGGSGFAYRNSDRPGTTHWSENFDVRYPNQAVHCQQMQLLPAAAYASTNINTEYLVDVPLPGVTSPPAGAGAVLALGKGYIASYTPTNLTTNVGSMFNRIYEASAPAIAFGRKPAVFGSYTYIGNLNGTSFLRRGHDGLAYSSGPNQPAQVFLNSGDRLNFFWQDAGGVHTRSIAQGVAGDMMATGNYSATINVGPGHLPPLDAIDRDRQVFVGMANGLHAGDTSGTFVNVLPDMSAQSHSENARSLTVYNTEIQVPHIGGLWSFHPSTFLSEAREEGPLNRGDRSPLHGRLTSVTALGPWLYAGLWTGSQSYIMVGRDGIPSFPEQGRKWMPMQRLPHTARVSRIHFDGITSASGGREIPQRMWVATDASLAGTAPLYVTPVPRGNDNPLAPDPTFTANYVGSARIDFGRDNRGAPATLKVFRMAEVRADFLASGSNYADLFYSIDGGNRTYLGRAQNSPRSELWFSGLNGNFTTGQDIEISLESYTASQNVSPVYYEVIVRGTLRPRMVDEITAVVRVADGMADRRGVPMRPAAQILDEMRALATSTSPARMSDLTGAGAWVLIRPNLEEVEAYQQGSDYPEIQLTAKMAVLDFTGNTLTSWDTLGGYTWDELAAHTWAQVANLPASP